MTQPAQLVSPRGQTVDLTYSEVSDNNNNTPKPDMSQKKPAKIEISAAAKSLIRGLVVPNSKKRMSINKIKLHEFFKPIKFSDIEKERIKMPKVNLRDPKSGEFDNVEPDSADEDFEHEYEELCLNQNDRSSSNSSHNFDHLKETIQVGPIAGKGNQTH